MIFPAAISAAAPLDVVLIVADDLGWADLACYGSSYHESPALDRLAEQGVRFTDAYAMPNCAPSRAALMTGRQGSRTGIYTVGSGARGKAENRRMIPAKNKTELELSEVTIAETLRPRGYRTGFFGKWHLGGEGRLPTDQGFDVNVGGNHLGHPKSYFSPYRNEQLSDGPEGEHLTARLGEEASDFIKSSGDKPIFLSLSFYAVHTPIQAREDLTKRFEGKVKGEHHRNAKYAAMLLAMDEAIAQVLETLDQCGRGDALVIFIGDNGGFGGYEPPIRSGFGPTDNTPLRGGKGQLFEGGVRVPLIVRWPGKAPAGELRSQPATVLDILPTIADAASADLPEVDLDGSSLRQAIADDVGMDRSLHWHFPGYLEAPQSQWRTTPASSMRKGDWKIIEWLESGQVELYNLAEDPAEANDAAHAYPEVATRMKRELARWRTEINAPMPTPKN